MSALLDAVQCITPNPDISGIGIRSSIYLQAILTLVQPIVAAADGKIDEKELQSLHALYVGVLLPGLALLFSAVIQAKTFGLSVYHATIVLNLSWINNTSALTFFTFVAINEQARARAKRVKRVRQLEMQLAAHTQIRDIPRRREESETEWWSERQVQNGKNGGATAIYELGTFSREVSQSSDGVTEEQVYESTWMETDTVTGSQKDLVVASDRSDGHHHSHKLRSILRSTKHLGAQEKAKIGREKQVVGEAIEKEIHKVRGEIAELDGLIALKAVKPPVWFMAALASLHLTVIGGLGLWLWFNINTFGNNPDCTPFTHFIIFGIAVPITSKALRIVSLVTYILSTIPMLNIGICIVGAAGLTYVLVYPVNPRRRSRKEETLGQKLIDEEGDRRVFFMSLCITLLCQLYFIVCTELTIRNNKSLLEEGEAHESDWTFGQTLAVALTVLPVKEIIKFLWEKFGEGVIWTFETPDEDTEVDVPELAVRSPVRAPPPSNAWP